MGTGVESRRRTQDGNGNGDEGGSRGGIGDGKGNRIGEGEGEGKELWYPSDHGRTVEDQALQFLTRCYLCRQEVAPAGSQQLRAQGPAPVRRCCTKRRTGHQGREGGNGDGDRDRGGDGNEDEYGNEHKVRDWGENVSGTETGTRIEMGVDGRETLENFEIVLAVDRSVSTIAAPPHASDGFKTDSAPFLPHFVFVFVDPTYSCGCYCKYKSITL